MTILESVLRKVLQSQIDSRTHWKGYVAIGLVEMETGVGWSVAHFVCRWLGAKRASA